MILSLWAGMASAADLTLAFPADEDLSENLRAASLVATAIDEGEQERRNLVAAAQADYQRLLAVLFEAGYFGPIISITVDGVEAAELPTIGQGGGVGNVTLRVEPGARFLFGAASVAPTAPGTELPEGFAPGEPAGTAVIRQAASAAVDGWRAGGYAKAEVSGQDITANHPASRLDARIAIAPGPRLLYGVALVEGAERVRSNHIARIADLRQGQVFDPDEVQAAARRLQRTGAFSSVSITEADDIGPADTLPMTIQVVERLPRRFGAGAEISSDEGLSTSAFWLHRNLTGYADSLRIEGGIEGIGGNSGGEDYSLTFAYNRPATFNPETDLFVNGGIESLDQPSFSSDRAYIEGGARRIVSEEFQYSYGIGYQYSETTDAFGTREFSILSLPLEATYDRRDDALNPKDGFYIEADLRPFQGFLTAGTGALFNADLRGYQGFGEGRKTVIAARLQLGSLVGPEINDAPSEMLFFSGGGGSVRGQDFQSLGVTLPSGDVVGGRSFVGLSTELRRDVTENIGVVGFVDYGMISPDSGFANGESHVGAGLGVRYNTGIGPIRLDVGLPVSGPGDQSGVSIYIGIGQAF
ncbi:autotransporter secretion outer membrane protein TamA [Jannaschia pohangensis]|uniref:Autotransporter secretion outer membrane protein TamA n=2 Tax=Jannaschia pohangensis TaxID=390807 RepID=A0A1I3JW91_9RHOB|nr:autotransporter secretion outer membrane protein TamA [Jannaschia pohangensis]